MQASRWATMKAKRFVYAKAFVGEPKVTDFELVEEELPALQDGEILTEAEYLSVDPYMRPYMAGYPVGVTMIGGQVAKIIESKNDKYPKDSYVFGQFGWRTHTIHKPTEARDCYVLPNFGELPRSLGVGYLGMPGNTAYFGFLEICKPKEGETVVVSGAAGAVGTLVGQIAKLKGCKVIGFAGSKEKCDWIVNKLGFDHAINYKDGNLYKALKAAAPNGVDCYFDNTGGEISSTVISQMNLHGRISVCGSISSYNSDPKDWPKMPHVQPPFVFNQLTMQGFIVTRWNDRWFEGIEAVKQWIKDGKVQYDETVTEGFENMPTALIEMLRGKNFGKAVVKV